MTQELDNGWRLVREKFGKTAQNVLWLDVLEAAYCIQNCQQALHAIPDFLGRFLIRDFDYKGFRQVLGDAVDVDDGLDELGPSLDADMQAVAKLMLRLVVTIAKSQNLCSSEWQEANEACGKAVRSLPACYRLQRQLPGALNDARALRCLKGSSEDGLSSFNPWESQEAQSLFEARHEIAWSDVEALLANDGGALESFSGPLLVQQLVHRSAVSIVHMCALSDCGAIQKGDTLLWEVDAGLGSLLQQSFVIDGHWRLLESEFCFLSSFESICPEWAFCHQNAISDMPINHSHKDSQMSEQISEEINGDRPEEEPDLLL